MKKIILFFSFALLICGGLTSCGVFKKQDPADKQLKVLEKKRRQKEKEADQLYRKAIKKHMRMQQKSVRKRMRGNYARADRINDNKREFFLKRWFAKGMKTKRAKSGK